MSRTNLLISLSIAIFVALMGVLLVPIESPWSYNTDEAIEFSRLFHTSLGFRLYSQVWSDHPPGWTWLLHLWSSIFGISLFASKGLALLLAAAAMVAFYWILRLFFDQMSAVFGILLFSSTARFLPAISSVTIDMPSLDLSLLGMAFFLYGLKGGSRWLVGLSGIFFAYAMTIKFFAVLPIFSLFVCSGLLAKHLGGHKHLKLRWLWLSVTVIGFALLMLTYWPFPYYHLVQFHTNARKFLASETLLKLFQRAFKTDVAFLLVSLASILLLLTRFKNQIWRVAVPVVWLGLMLVQFSVQRPVWWIYYPLIALPLTWIACLPFSQFLSQLRDARLNSIKKLQFFLPMILLIFWLLPIGQAYLRYFKEDAVLIANFRSNPTLLPQQELLDSVLQFSKNNKWILTDDGRILYRDYQSLSTRTNSLGSFYGFVKAPSSTASTAKRRLSVRANPKLLNVTLRPCRYLDEKAVILSVNFLALLEELS